MKYLQIDTSGLNPNIHSIITVRYYDDVTKESIQINGFTPGKTYDKRTLDYLGYDVKEFSNKFMAKGDDELKKFFIEKVKYSKDAFIVYNAPFIEGFLKEYCGSVKTIDLLSVTRYLNEIHLVKLPSRSLVDVYTKLVRKPPKTKIEMLIDIQQVLKEGLCW